MTQQGRGINSEAKISPVQDEWQMTAEDEQLLLDKSVSLPMGYEQLKRYLPHRYPFMLVDRDRKSVV